jgi:cation transport ATPase
MGICKEKSEKEGEEGNSKRLLVAFAVWLGITILVTGLLDLFVNGLPLGFTIPILNLPATSSLVLYYVAILSAAIYIGVVGLKELVLEKRFSVEFLMAVAGLGALFLDYRFEAATVLFLYCLAEYFEGYIQSSKANG